MKLLFQSTSIWWCNYWYYAYIQNTTSCRFFIWYRHGPQIVFSGSTRLSKIPITLNLIYWLQCVPKQDVDMVWWACSSQCLNCLQIWAYQTFCDEFAHFAFSLFIFGLGEWLKWFVEKWLVFEEMCQVWR